MSYEALEGLIMPLGTYNALKAELILKRLEAVPGLQEKPRIREKNPKRASKNLVPPSSFKALLGLFSLTLAFERPFKGLLKAF